jgi:hypothetical protein
MSKVMNHPFAVAVRLNGELVILTTHKTMEEAAKEATSGRSAMWFDAFVVAR